MLKASNLQTRAIVFAERVLSIVAKIKTFLLIIIMYVICTFASQIMNHNNDNILLISYIIYKCALYIISVWYTLYVTSAWLWAHPIIEHASGILHIVTNWLHADADILAHMSTLRAHGMCLNIGLITMD